MPPTSAATTANLSYDADPAALLKALLSTIEEQIIPLTSKGVASGSKLFGAAILSKEGLVPLTVATNNEAVSPLLHGEINCIQQFFAQTDFPAIPSSSSPSSSSSSSSSSLENENGIEDEMEENVSGRGTKSCHGGDGHGTRSRPNPRDCVFLATHEPCSLCLSGITWSGFDNFFYLFTYEDSRDLFSIPYDIDILQEVFRVPAVLSSPPLHPKQNTSESARPTLNESESPAAVVGGVEEEDIDARPLYNRKNKFFHSRSLHDLIREIAAQRNSNSNDRKSGESGTEAEVRAEVKKWEDELRRVKNLYNGLSDTYQKGKTGGVETASFWK